MGLRPALIASVVLHGGLVLLALLAAAHRQRPPEPLPPPSYAMVFRSGAPERPAEPSPEESARDRAPAAAAEPPPAVAAEPPPVVAEPPPPVVAEPPPPPVPPVVAEPPPPPVVAEQPAPPLAAEQPEPPREAATEPPPPSPPVLAEAPPAPPPPPDAAAEAAPAPPPPDAIRPDPAPAAPERHAALPLPPLPVPPPPPAPPPPQRLPGLWLPGGASLVPPAAPRSPAASRGGLDLSLGSIVGRMTPEPEAQVRGAQVGPDWRNAFRRWLEEHKRYPEAARVLGEQGTNRIELLVAPDGRVRAARLVLRSGSVWLDSGTVSLFRGAVLPPFPPGADPGGVTVNLTINYILIRN